MGPLLVLAAIVIVALLIVRLGAAALMRTGLSAEIARFQAHSAFFGVGFTTREAELVVNHPVRRRIVRDLIVAGNLGIFSAMASILVAFLRSDPDGGLDDWQKAVFIVAGAILLAVLVQTRPVQWLIDRTVAATIERMGVGRPESFELLLRVHHGYVVSEIALEHGHWLAGRTLRASNLSTLHILVLGIAHADGVYDGTPGPDSVLLAGDVLTVYGLEANVQRLTGRRSPPDA